MDFELKIIMPEILPHLVPIHILDVKIRDCETSSPFFVAISKIGVLDIEYPVYEREVVLNLLVTFDMETVVSRRSFGLGH
jgi:hypothetical protein